MTYNPEIHHRRSIRLREYDYSQEGLYFVTVCTYQRQCLFGEIIDGKMNLNDMGRMVEEQYRLLEDKYPSIVCRDYVVMPNHFHCVIQLTSGNTAKLGQIVGFFKYRTMKCSSFPPPLWQRNYYEHIIRDRNSYADIVAYIQHNPMNWMTDELFG